MTVSMQPAGAGVAAGPSRTALGRRLEALPHLKRLTDADTEGIYSIAYREFGQGHYENALRYFKLLVVYRPTDRVYLLGAALCLRRLRRYELAIAAYGMLRSLEPGDPAHPLAQAECLLLCYRREQARELLVQVVGDCAKRSDADDVRARAQALLELMRPRNDDLGL
jgi:type III secretion system low calcium response chaperone LcrH/SycD